MRGHSLCKPRFAAPSPRRSQRTVRSCCFAGNHTQPQRHQHHGSQFITDKHACDDVNANKSLFGNERETPSTRPVCFGRPAAPEAPASAARRRGPRLTPGPRLPGRRLTPGPGPRPAPGPGPRLAPGPGPRLTRPSATPLSPHPPQNRGGSGFRGGSSASQSPGSTPKPESSPQITPGRPGPDQPGSSARARLRLSLQVSGSLQAGAAMQNLTGNLLDHLRFAR
jgi:hypothetical protein